MYNLSIYAILVKNYYFKSFIRIRIFLWKRFNMTWSSADFLFFQILFSTLMHVVVVVVIMPRSFYIFFTHSHTHSHSSLKFLTFACFCVFVCMHEYCMHACIHTRVSFPFRQDMIGYDRAWECFFPFLYCICMHACIRYDAQTCMRIYTHTRKATTKKVSKS